VALEIEEICFEEAHEIERRRKVRMAEIVSDDGSIPADKSPFSKENMTRAGDVRVKLTGRERFDIQNIGSGTRCSHCGLLHFCWTPRCAGCKANMEFNLGC
jgi:hypothetical protein